MSAFLGMFGTGNFSAEERPENWRQMILDLDPNGDAPLTAIMSMMGSEGTDDPTFHWFERVLASQAGDVTNVYINESMTTAYTTSVGEGGVVYVKCAAAFADQVRVGHQILLRTTATPEKEVNTKVLARVSNGANSKITCMLIETERVSAALATCDHALIVGNINPEGGDMPDSISYSPTPYENYTQIFRTPLSITRTARKTKVRTKDKYQDMLKEALKYHGIEMEKNTIFSVPSVRTGDNGKPERTTGGLIYMLRERGGIEDSYTTSTDVTNGASWLAEGEDWLDEKCREMFRFGPRERLAFCDDVALQAIQKLVKKSDSTLYSITSSTKDYGIHVNTWVTPFGVLHLKTHPLFTFGAVPPGSLLAFAPEYLKYRFIDDTKFYEDGENKNTGHTRRDSTDEEFLTEAGYEIHHAETFAYLHGLGTANTNS